MESILPGLTVTKYLIVCMKARVQSELHLVWLSQDICWHATFAKSAHDLKSICDMKIHVWLSKCGSEGKLATFKFLFHYTSLQK